MNNASSRAACALIATAVAASTALPGWFDVVPVRGRTNESSAASASVTPSVNGATKPCPACHGIGKIPCPGPGCKKGAVDCPGPCLKLSVGHWQHLPGHDQKELFYKVDYLDEHGFPAWSAWSQAHVGQVIQMQNGKPVNIGECTICGGSGKLQCKVCKGQGVVDCPTCRGTKVVPASWKPPEPPKHVIRLKDGGTITGRIVAAGDTQVLITTDDGNSINIPKDQLESDDANPQ